jgi:hypothetical protein
MAYPDDKSMTKIDGNGHVPVTSKNYTCATATVQDVNGTWEVAACRKDRGMNPPIPVEEQLPIATHRETDTPESDELAQCSFTAEESAALLWLRHWYQSGGSDRMEIVRHWEFLKWLMMDKLEA